MGSLAYIGNAAVFDFGGMNFGGGLLAVYLWRSVYFAQSVSLRTRILLAMDWSKRALFGRGEYFVDFVRFAFGAWCADVWFRYDELLDPKVFKKGVLCIYVGENLYDGSMKGILR